MSSTIDQKLNVLFDLYKDSDFAANATKEVEAIRRHALLTGALTSGGLIALNEFVRLTCRSPLFKLNPLGLALVVFGPTVIAKYYARSCAGERIDNMWRIHCNRKEQGLGGTYKESGVYLDKRQDIGQFLHSGLNISLDQIVSGNVMNPTLDNPFTRYNEDIADNPHHLYDIDDIPMVEYREFERTRPFRAKKGTTEGETFAIPIEDNDEKLVFYDLQGEGIWTNPPDENQPVVDHRLDEENIWAFPLSGYNQYVIKNNWARNVFDTNRRSHAPFWGQKLLTPAFTSHDKTSKFFKQWNIRLDFEILKMRQAMAYDGKDSTRKAMKDEVEGFIAQAHQTISDEKLEDIYVTRHEPKPKKYATLGKAEDEQFYAYKKALAEYNNDMPERVYGKDHLKYAKGTLLQKILDPLANSKRLENGAIFYEVEDQELDPMIHNEELLKAEWELAQAGNNEAWDIDEEEIRLRMMMEMGTVNDLFNEERMNQQFNELAVFKEGEEYDYVTDLHRGYENSLSKSTASQIFETIPAHVFWDIKRPTKPDEEYFLNKKNPFRQYPFSSFYDYTTWEDYNDMRDKKENIKDSVTFYRNY